MTAEASIQPVTVACDGPGCEVKGEAPAGPAPKPDGWLSIWGPSARLGHFDFHSGACYDAWLAEVQAAQAAEADRVAALEAAQADDEGGAT